MPRYYFDLVDGSGTAPDEEGMVLKDLDAAQAEAARTLGDMIWEAAGTFKGTEAQQMSVEVRDDAGPVMHVRFSFELWRKN